MANRIVWFDMPVTDLERAMAFYAGVLNIELDMIPGAIPFAVMRHSDDDVAGCLVKSDDDRPSDHGPLLYFPVNGRLPEAASLVEEFGGSVLVPPHDTPPFGSRCIVLDSEGNRICLHSE